MAKNKNNKFSKSTNPVSNMNDCKNVHSPMDSGMNSTYSNVKSKTNSKTTNKNNPTDCRG
ncbi:hypothetical protein RBG61_13920 [Paludicola sp. MB14-C6]|uniref:hypothetical protein n=1 Tax=Paludihabitans sp. MB14-C6 TaxID=3070656 RepID=UPI0027DC88BB|nr:hypothetical protein [Paludicola sp. MB14-C6]WMJ23068.1 hypothetical protein RBG61_13920 [Paludicola sp. MB14-C6]